MPVHEIAFRPPRDNPDGKHFLLLRHANDGLSSGVLHSVLSKDMSHRSLLQIAFILRVPFERLQVPFSDENTIPYDLCTYFRCSIKQERQSSIPYTRLFRPYPKRSRNLALEYQARPWIRAVCSCQRMLTRCSTDCEKQYYHYSKLRSSA